MMPILLSSHSVWKCVSECQSTGVGQPEQCDLDIVPERKWPLLLFRKIRGLFLLLCNLKNTLLLLDLNTNCMI